MPVVFGTDAVNASQASFHCEQENQFLQWVYGKESFPIKAHDLNGVAAI